MRILILLAIFLLPLIAQAQVFTSKEGKTRKGKFISFDNGKVRVELRGEEKTADINVFDERTKRSITRAAAMNQFGADATNSMLRGLGLKRKAPRQALAHFEAGAMKKEPRCCFEVGIGELSFNADYRRASKFFERSLAAAKPFAFEEEYRYLAIAAANNYALTLLRQNKRKIAFSRFASIATFAKKVPPEVIHNLETAAMIYGNAADQKKIADVQRSLPPGAYAQPPYKPVGWIYMLGEPGEYVGLMNESVKVTGPKHTIEFEGDWLNGKQSWRRSVENTQKVYVYHGMLDRACTLCKGTGEIRCTEGNCHGGKLTYEVPQRIATQGGGFIIRKIRQVRPCQKCGADGKQQCTRCGGSKVDSAFTDTMEGIRVLDQ